MEKCKDAQLDWQKYGKFLVGIKGDQIIGVCGKMEDMPCEAFEFQPLSNVFVSIEAAQAAAEESYLAFTQQQKPKQDVYQRVLMAMGKALVGAQEDEKAAV